METEGLKSFAQFGSVYGIICNGDALDNWIKPAAGHLYSDRDALIKSAERIRDLGARKLYYGHGKPTENRFKMLK